MGLLTCAINKSSLTLFFNGTLSEQDPRHRPVGIFLEAKFSLQQFMEQKSQNLYFLN